MRLLRNLCDFCVRLSALILFIPRGGARQPSSSPQIDLDRKALVNAQQAQAVPLQADPDLLAAALLNLFDNALRYGAKRVTLEIITPRLLRVSDDGPGVSEKRRLELQEALGRQADDLGTGLGLRLADLVARAHGGCLRLLSAEQGFALEIDLG